MIELRYMVRSDVRCVHYAVRWDHRAQQRANGCAIDLWDALMACTRR